MTHEEILAFEEGLRSWMIGLPIEEAYQRLRETFGDEYGIRPMCIDGEYMFGTCDYDLTRVNVATQDDQIVSVISIG